MVAVTRFIVINVQRMICLLLCSQYTTLLLVQMNTFEIFFYTFLSIVPSCNKGLDTTVLGTTLLLAASCRLFSLIDRGWYTFLL